MWILATLYLAGGVYQLFAPLVLQGFRYQRLPGKHETLNHFFLMVDQPLRRWANIESTLGGRLSLLGSAS